MDIRGRISAALVAAAVAATPLGASAQGVVRGANEGARDGAAVGDRAGGAIGGVVGGIVGGAVGAATGAVGGVLGVDTRPRFREYVVRERRPSYTYREEVRVGTVLPSDGVTYYEAPEEYGLRNHGYTIVNDRTVIVDRSSGRIVEILD